MEDPDKTAAVDAAAAPGRKTLYRVFALAHEGDGKYSVLCETPVKGIEVPAPEPNEKPDAPDEPASTTLGLTLSIKEGDPFVDWTRFEGDGFDYYKVVRSKDSTVRFPAGDGDAVVGAFEDPGRTSMLDKDAAGGKTYWYRVFAVNKTEAGYEGPRRERARKATTPAPEPAPDPTSMGFELDLVRAGRPPLGAVRGRGVRLLQGHPQHEPRPLGTSRGRTAAR